MGRLTRLSGAESPMPRWGRRLLLAGAAGAGIWLLGCLSQHATAQAETVWPNPAAQASSVGLMIGPSPEPALPLPARPVIRWPGLQLGPGVPDNLVQDVPALPLPPLAGVMPPSVPPVGGALLPVVGKPGSQPASIGRHGAAADQASVRRSEPGIFRWPLSSLGAVERSFDAGPGRMVGESAPHPRPIPLPGTPRRPANDSGGAPGSPYSLPLSEPADGPSSGPFTGLAEPWSAEAAGLRQRAYLPDTPPD